MYGIVAKTGHLNPSIRLARAIEDFEKDLSDEQKAAFRSTRDQSPPEQDDAMRLAARINANVAREVGQERRCFTTRLLSILQAIQRFAAVGDVLAGGSQNLIVCGVWSLVRVTLLAFVGTYSRFDKISEFFMVLGRSAPHYEDIAALQLKSGRLQSYLSEYFLVIVRFCHDLIKSKQQSLVDSFLSSLFGSSTESYKSEIESWARAINDEVSLLITKQLQEQGRNMAKGLKLLKYQSHHTERDIFRQILDSCSTYDYQTVWREIRRCGSTCWFAKQPEYQQWRVRTTSCTLLYSGKLGSGKSISLANLVEDLYLKQQNRHSVAYFFCRYDIPESLRARTILGSLARQLLSNLEKPNKLPGLLKVMPPPVFDSEGVLNILQRALKGAPRAYVVLDGLDECDESQKEDMIRFLRELQFFLPVRVCLSLRQEAGNALAQLGGRLVDPVMISVPEDSPDIAEFIEAELARRVKADRLVLGDPTLIIEIRETLLEKAQGMFLWVVLQIQSLCEAKTDDSIRRALADLPRDLPGTFSRILEHSGGTDKTDQRQTLELITAACRPLTTSEVREALAVAPGTTEWNPTRVPNDIYSFLACCGSLVIVDEETLSVKLIHPSVKQFLLSGPDRSSGQTFTINDANNAMAIIVVTYLNYDVFETQLSHRAAPRDKHVSIPTAVLSSVLDSAIPKSITLRLLKSAKKPDAGFKEVVAAEMQTLAATSSGHFCFLPYAKLHWAQHVARYQGHDESIYTSVHRMLNRYTLLVDKRDALGRTPLSWAAEANNEALVRLFITNGAQIGTSDASGRTPLLFASEGGHEGVTRLLLDEDADIETKTDGQTILSRAAARGDVGMMRLLVDRGADVQAKDRRGYTPLQQAVNGGHAPATLQLLVDKESNGKSSAVQADWGLLYLAIGLRHTAVVRVLLENRHYPMSSKDAAPKRYPLEQAAEIGHEGIMELLLEHGADVESKDDSGRTALQSAASWGHEAAVRLLLKYGANIEAKSNLGMTPLMVAAWAGREAVVRLVLKNNADIMARSKAGDTALLLAAKKKSEPVVRLLLENDAEKDFKNKKGRTALSLAAGAGCAPVVRVLVEHGADAGIKDANGKTALDWADETVAPLLLQLISQPSGP